MIFRVLRKILLGVASVIMVSCNSYNRIYFDLHNQAVVACSGGPINRLYITDNNRYTLTIFEILENQEGSSSFSLEKIDQGYIERDNIDGEEFKLQPNSSYSIENRSHFHVASHKINIKTDSMGKVVFTDSAICK